MQQRQLRLKEWRVNNFNFDSYTSVVRLANLLITGLIFFILWAVSLQLIKYSCSKDFKKYFDEVWLLPWTCLPNNITNKWCRKFSLAEIIIWYWNIACTTHNYNAILQCCLHQRKFILLNQKGTRENLILYPVKWQFMMHGHHRSLYPTLRVLSKTIGRKRVHRIHCNWTSNLGCLLQRAGPLLFFRKHPCGRSWLRFPVY